MEEGTVLRGDAPKGKDLLTLQEKAHYYEIKAKLYKSDLDNSLSGHEYKRLYKKASKILLGAVDRELASRGLA
ncbi:hypothetical protein [Neobacillus sp. YIM B06451]|uniref:hypothetical protein n=1 Tax=Neobacillus sp. YIM B06451 TaxID=3070994 RepID=UPI00292F299B|nr:hypothetical protein [Neobacillus sp. YIM B06451]